MWASERSDERHAQPGAPSQEPVGTDPRTGFSSGIPWWLVFFKFAGIFKFSAVLPYDVSEIVASYGISPSWGRCLLEYEVSFCGFVTVSMAVSDDEHVNGCMLEFLSRLLFL